MAVYDYTDLAKSTLPAMNTAFMGGYKGAPARRQAIATQIASNQKMETYPWVVDHRGPQIWGPERLTTAGAENYIEVTNEDYEMTWAVERDAYRYEKYGQMKFQAGARGRVLSDYIDELVLALFTTAESALTYNGDGATYVAAADHSEGASGTQSNLGSSALDADTLFAARLAMMKFKDARGKPIGLIGDTVVVPPDLEQTIRKIIIGPRESGTADYEHNVWQNAYKYVVNPQWTDTDAWALVCTTSFIKPMMWQEFQGPSPVDMIKDELKLTKRAWFGSDMTGKAAFTDWRLIYFVTP